MKKAHVIISLVSCLLILFQTMQSAFGQSSDDKFTKHPDALKVRQLIAAVQSDPNNLNAHEAFINAFDINDPRIVSQYKVWMKKYPKTAMVPFALGKTYYKFLDSLCKGYLQKAVEIDTAMALGWAYFSHFAAFTGDNKAALYYMQRAAEADPKNADCAFDYAYLQKDGDPAKYDSLMLKVVFHFPDNIKAVKALYYLALLPYNANERTAYYEAMYNIKSQAQAPWYRAGMSDYYDYLINTSPGKAFDLALRLVIEMKINRQLWKQRFADARNFTEARKALDDHNPNEAENRLKQVNLSYYTKISAQVSSETEETLALYKAEVSAERNDTHAAYDSVATYYSNRPSTRLRKTLIDYAARLGMDSCKADTDIWKRRNAMAWKPTDFTLENYANHKPVSLSDYRGKVVLVTYWAPSCGPCRLELPRVESILKELNNKNVAYIGINAVNRDDEFVMPLVQSNGYTFIPLRIDGEKSVGNLPDVTGIPANFLIDQRGRVIFSGFLINDSNKENLELMITELLKFSNSEHTNSLTMTSK